MVETIDARLARIRREREQRTGVRQPADVPDLLTRLTLGGTRPTIFDEEDDDGLPLEDGAGTRALTFAQTEAGVRLAASLAQETERIAGRERLKLEDTLHSLAKELLPPGDVETAMRQVRRGEVVKSKLAFQAVLQNLTDETAAEERRRDLELAEENERRTLREARARITIDLIGRDIGRAILFALSGAGGGET